MPSDKEAIAAAIEIFPFQHKEQYDAGIPSGIQENAARIITAAYAPKLEAYERLREMVIQDGSHTGDSLRGNPDECDVCRALANLDALEKMNEKQS